MASFQRDIVSGPNFVIATTRDALGKESVILNEHGEPSNFHPGQHVRRLPIGYADDLLRKLEAWEFPSW